MQQVATTDCSDSSPTKLINILESLCTRMLKCSLEDFDLVGVAFIFKNIFCQKGTGLQFDCSDISLAPF
jgi:hypothetical protein